MCARTVDESFGNGDRTSFWSDARQSVNDVTSSPMTSSGEFPVARRPRRPGVPSAWRRSLPSTITPSTTGGVTAVRRPTTNTLPIPISISGDDNEPVFDVRRLRPRCRFIATGSRNATESGSRLRPTCLRYSYWLTLDDRRYASKYSPPTTPDEFNGHEHQLPIRHFRPRSCDIINDSREAASRRVASPRFVTNSVDDNDSVFRRCLTSGHVTGTSASGQIISSITSASDDGIDCRDHTTHCDGPTLRLNADDNHHGPSAAVVDRSLDEIEGQRRLSLSKIGDSGLGTSIHSEQTSPDDTDIVDHHQHQQKLHQPLCDDDDDDDDDETNDVIDCQCRNQCEVQSQVQVHIDDDDYRTKLTTHKCE